MRQSFCGKCGSELKLDEKFCPRCGQQVGNVCDSLSFNEVKEIEKPKKRTKVIILSSILTVLLIGGLITLFLNLFGDNHEEVAKKYVASLLERDINSINDCLVYHFDDEQMRNFACRFALRSMSGDSGMGIPLNFDFESWQQEGENFVYAKNKEEMLSMAHSGLYENNMLFCVETVNSRKINNSELNQLANDINETWEAGSMYFMVSDFIDINDIKNAYQVDVQLTMMEPYDNNEQWTEGYSYYIVKYKGRWKVLSSFIDDLWQIYQNG